MSQSSIEAALAVFEASNGVVGEANGFEAVMKAGCGVCDSYKCQME